MILPIRIDPFPIIDALIEIRFSTEIHPNAVFGLFYNALQDDFEKVENLIRTEFEQDAYKSTLQIANNANYNGRFGSIIDIDTFIESGVEEFFLNKEQLLNNGHDKEKDLFLAY